MAAASSTVRNMGLLQFRFRQTKGSRGFDNRTVEVMSEAFADATRIPGSDADRADRRDLAPVHWRRRAPGGLC